MPNVLRMQPWQPPPLPDVDCLNGQRIPGQFRSFDHGKPFGDSRVRGHGMKHFGHETQLVGPVGMTLGRDARSLVPVEKARGGREIRCFSTVRGK